VTLEAKLYYRDTNATFHPLFHQPVATLPLNVTTVSQERKEKQKKDPESASIKYSRIEPQLAYLLPDAQIFAVAHIKSKKPPAARVEVLFPGKNSGEAKVGLFISYLETL